MPSLISILRINLFVLYLTHQLTPLYPSLLLFIIHFIILLSVYTPDIPISLEDYTVMEPLSLDNFIIDHWRRHFRIFILNDQVHSIFFMHFDANTSAVGSCIIRCCCCYMIVYIFFLTNVIIHNRESSQKIVITISLK